MMYEFVCSHIPHVIQSLYIPEVLESTTLVEIRDALRPNQIQCKAWLLEQLVDVDRSSKVLVIGSWIGFTSYCLHKMGFTYIAEVDPDRRLEPIAHHINHENSNFIHISRDVNDVDVSTFDVVINTSCEHISNNKWFNSIRSGCLVILQSTDFVSDDHVNTVSGLNDMQEKYPLTCCYMGEKQFSPMFTRYMICGTKS